MVQFNETGKNITKWRFVGQLYDVRLLVRWLSTCMILPTCVMSFLCDVFKYICMMSLYLYDVCLPVWCRLYSMRSVYLFVVSFTCMMSAQLHDTLQPVWSHLDNMLPAYLCGIFLPVLYFSYLYDAYLPVWCLFSCVMFANSWTGIVKFLFRFPPVLPQHPLQPISIHSYS
jgi:hypothetical protein